MRAAAPTPPGAGAPTDARLREAARALEGMLLRTIVSSSGAFTGGEGAGSAVRAGMFADALAEAVARSGGIGLAGLVERSLSGALPPDGAARPPQLPPAGQAHTPGAGARAPDADGHDLRSADPLRAAAPGASELSAGPRPAHPLLDPRTSAPPLPGTPVRVSSPFGARTDPFTGAPGLHQGVDLAAPEGTLVAAAAPGVVRAAGERGGYGLCVEIAHEDGTSTLYAHAAETLVVEGEPVAAGQPIARVGSTGRSTGPHLHFEVRQLGRPVDPGRALKVYAQRAEGILAGSPLPGVVP
jgi:murein DD-endopeptidase MepM/ murein hydrolase activator NlpD